MTPSTAPRFSDGATASFSIAEDHANGGTVGTVGLRRPRVLGAVGPRATWATSRGGSHPIPATRAPRSAAAVGADVRDGAWLGGLAVSYTGCTTEFARRAGRTAHDPGGGPPLWDSFVPRPLRAAGAGRRRDWRSAAHARRGGRVGDQRAVDDDGLPGPARTHRVGVLAQCHTARATRRRGLRAAVDGGRGADGRPAHGRRLARSAWAGGQVEAGARRGRGAGAVRRSGGAPGRRQRTDRDRTGSGWRPACGAH